MQTILIIWIRTFSTVLLLVGSRLPLLLIHFTSTFSVDAGWSNLKSFRHISLLWSDIQSTRTNPTKNIFLYFQNGSFLHMTSCGGSHDFRSRDFWSHDFRLQVSVRQIYFWFFFQIINIAVTFTWIATLLSNIK